jgi:hypothetical protein
MSCSMERSPFPLFISPTKTDTRRRNSKPIPYSSLIPTRQKVLYNVHKPYSAAIAGARKR